MQGRAGTQVDRVTWRMYDVEAFLETDLRKRRWLRIRSRIESRRARLAARRRQVTAPRIGVLAHQKPSPLLLPARYWHTTAPDNPPAISIVTPSFGQGRYIERTLFSVTGQNYPRLEYIVQDGGSTDETVDVLRHHEAELSQWESGPDGGQADALNRGFARTSGEIMSYLNSDDLLLPGSLAYIARYFATHPDVDVVYGNRVLIDSGDRNVGAWILPGHDDAAMTMVDFIPQETLFWRRRAWEAAGGLIDTSLHFAIDWDLLLRLRASGAKFAHVPRFLGAFRVHDAQKTTREQTVSEVECARLRRELHGREVSQEEAASRVDGFCRRHVRAHLRQRLLDRLPISRTEVSTVPPNAWLRTPEARRRQTAPPAARPKRRASTATKPR
jgi:GT2 family glycosyltransferase